MSEGKDRYGVLHSDDVRQVPEKAFGELSHQVVMHEPVISNNHDVNIKLVYIIINRTKGFTPKNEFSRMRFIKLM